MQRGKQEMKNEIIIKINRLKLSKFCNVCKSFGSDIDLIDGSLVFDAKDFDTIRLIDYNKDLCVHINSDDENEILRFNGLMWEFE